MRHGVKLIVALATGIIKSIPRIISAIFDIRRTMLTHVENIKEPIKQKASQIITKMVEGIKNMVGHVASAIGNIATTIKNKIQELISSAFNWGKDFVNGFKEGISNALGALKGKVDEMAGAIKSKLHFSKPDEGPLRDYETWMPDMIKGMVKSLDRAMPMLSNKVTDLANEMSMSPTLNGSYSSSPIVNVVVNNSFETDPLGQMVSKIKTFSNGAKNDYNYGYGG